MNNQPKSLFLIFVFGLISCQQQQPIQELKKQAKKIETAIESVVASNDENVFNTPPDSLDISAENYQKTMERIAQYKSKMNEETATKELQYMVADSLIPFWYGTPWDFNGIATEPNNGKIACGYFVFTLLEDVGFKLPRIKLSQAASESSIKALIPESSILRFSNQSKDTAIAKIKAQGDGLYLLGLDYHIGFIEVRGEDVWFMHSNFFTPNCVVKEKADNSYAFASSNYRIVGKLNNSTTIKKWLNNQAFTI